jgi:hypothetical protein
VVEAAGRLCSASFEAGRTMPSSCRQDAERVIRLAADPSARSALRSASMSLYRAGLRLALYLPLGVAMPPAIFLSGTATGFADVSPVFTLPSRAEATMLIEPASVNHPQSGLHA